MDWDEAYNIYLNFREDELIATLYGISLPLIPYNAADWEDWWKQLC